MAPMNSIFPNRLWKIHSFCRDSLSLVCGKWHRWILWKSSVRFLYSFQCFMPIKVFGQITSCRFQGCLWYVTCSCFSETSLFPHIKRRFWIENWGGRYILRSASKKTKNQNLSLPPPPPPLLPLAFGVVAKCRLCSQWPLPVKKHFPGGVVGTDPIQSCFYYFWQIIDLEQ